MGVALFYLGPDSFTGGCGFVFISGLVLVCHSCIIRGDYGSAMAIFKVLSDHILPCESMVAGLVRCGIMSGHSLAKILLDFGEFKIQNFQEGGSLLDVVHVSSFPLPFT